MDNTKPPLTNKHFSQTVFAKDITPQSLIRLVSAGTNLVLTLSAKQTPLTSLAAEFGLIPPPPGTSLLSYFPEREEPAHIVPVGVKSGLILSRNLTSPVWFSGVPHALGTSPLLVPILRAPAESFAAEVEVGGGGGADALVDAAEKTGEGLWAGGQMGLVTGFQALSGARVAWVGGGDVFGDEYARKLVGT